MSGNYLAIDVGATHTLFGIFDGHGTLEYKMQFLTSKGSFLETIRELKERAQEYTKDGLFNRRIAGIGVGVPAIYEKRTDSIKRAANLSNWEGENVKAVLRSQINNVPVSVFTDVYAALLGERNFGLGRGVSSFINISVGTGVGMGVWVNDTLLTGANNSAGSLGHVTFQSNGRQCACGKKGCVESYVCGQFMEEMFREEIKKRAWRLSTKFNEVAKVTSFDIIRGANAGDELCVKIVEKVGSNLGVIISNVILLFDPEIIILNGGIINHGPDQLLDKVREVVAENIFGEVKIEKSTLGDEASLYGNYYAVRNISQKT